MANFQPYEEGGITGKTKQQGLIDILQGAGGTAGSGQAPPMQADGPAPVAPPAAAPALGQYIKPGQGFEMDKFADPNHSEKYKIGDVFSRYDPHGGVTPELLKELNGLGIAEFSGQGDQLSVNNTKNDPRFGRGGTADVVKGLKGNNADTSWQPWFVDEGGQQQAQGGGGMPSFAGSNINGMLQSDAQGNIQQALAGLQQPGMLQQLIAALRGGQ